MVLLFTLNLAVLSVVLPILFNNKHFLKVVWYNFEKIYKQLKISVDNKNDGMQFQLHVQLHFAHNNVKKPTGTAIHISEFYVVVLHRYID